MTDRALAYIALGTNVGDRESHLKSARTALARLPESKVVAESTVEETDPIGPLPQARYLNQMVVLETSLEPDALLDELLRIERDNGRVRGERWAARTLDLDIVRFGDRELRTSRLTIPHPEIANRDFWRRELAELGAPSTEVELPDWAQVKRRRRAHIGRVVTLLGQWAGAMHLAPHDRRDWLDAGRFHDALRDAPVDELRSLAGSDIGEVELLHGPAVATYLARHGETRANVLLAVRYHSIGWKDWDRVGRALYMADYLEPGRKFDRERRAEFAARVPADFDQTFREVVEQRMAYAREQHFTIYPESAALLASVR